MFTIVIDLIALINGAAVGIGIRWLLRSDQLVWPSLVVSVVSGMITFAVLLAVPSAAMSLGLLEPGVIVIWILEGYPSWRARRVRRSLDNIPKVDSQSPATANPSSPAQAVSASAPRPTAEPRGEVSAPAAVALPTQSSSVTPKTSTNPDTGKIVPIAPFKTTPLRQSGFRKSLPGFCDNQQNTGS